MNRIEYILFCAVLCLTTTSCKKDNTFRSHSFKECEMIELTPYEPSGYQLIEIQFAGTMPHEYVRGCGGLTHFPDCQYCAQKEYDMNR